MAELLFDRISEPVSRRVTAGLVKIGLALRSQAWKMAGRQGLTPTQSQILGVMRSHSDRPARLSVIADELAITRATASGAVSTLVAKGLVEKRTATDDHRAVSLALTGAGRIEAERTGEWPEFLLRAVDTLSPAEQETFLKCLIKMVRALQLRGEIPVARLCVSCRYFRPNVHEDPHAPHHCAFVDAPFGDRHLRLDCADHEAAPLHQQESTWRILSQ